MEFATRGNNMTKGQAIQSFWERFDIPAYDETTVPDNAQFPYITYQVQTDSLDSVCMTNASLWYRSYSWKEISEKTEEISQAIARMNPPSIKIDGGRLYISKGVPFAQRMSDDSDDAIRRILLNINYEFLTEY
jgi:hypothetical protein